MDRLFRISQAHEAAKAQGGVVGLLKRGWWAVNGLLTFGRMFLLPVKSHDLPERVRLRPAW